MRTYLMGLTLLVALGGIGIGIRSEPRNLFAGVRADRPAAPERIWMGGVLAPIVVSAPAPARAASGTFYGGVLDPIVISATRAEPRARI